VRVLVAEDDSVLRRMLESFLVRWGYEVVLAKDGAEAWAILQTEDAPRLALLDWMMPGMDGVEVCHEVRKRVAQPYVYMLLLTARNDNLDVINGLGSGADDYLTKPFNPEELEARLRTGKRILDLEDRLVAAREAMYFKATHDAMTGLWNREAILDNLNRELIRARRQTAPLGILLLDLDRFKSINDTCGHPVGDDVLREAARRMLASVRVYDSVGRYGGEEFLIVLPGCDESSTREKAEQLRTALESCAVETSGGPLRVTLSIGALSTDVWREGDTDALLRAADAALYRAKDAGRNRVEIAVPGKVVLIPCRIEEARPAPQPEEH